MIPVMLAERRWVKDDAQPRLCMPNNSGPATKSMHLVQAYRSCKYPQNDLHMILFSLNIFVTCDISCFVVETAP